jgi:hypothetical protein
LIQIVRSSAGLSVMVYIIDDGTSYFYEPLYCYFGQSYYSTNLYNNIVEEIRISSILPNSQPGLVTVILFPIPRTQYLFKWKIENGEWKMGKPLKANLSFDVFLFFQKLFYSLKDHPELFVIFRRSRILSS